MDQEVLPEAIRLGGIKVEQPHRQIQDGKPVNISRPFYRGEHANFYPDEGSFERDDFLAAYFGTGIMPKAPFIDTDTVVVTFGSCFAKHISDHLAGIGFRVESRQGNKAYISAMGDGIVNTYAIRQQFEWAWENRVPEVSLWHGYDGREFGYDEDIRLDTKRIFDAAEVFIITLGLSEIWYDEPTGHVFWRAVPKENFDPARHKFRVATQAENLANLTAIRELIRKYRPDAKIVLTLSPIPLRATFRPIPCMVANTVSKANLRSALDELISAVDDPMLFYFPSYEIVGCFDQGFIPDRRHPHFHVLDLNMLVFERYYCTSGVTDAKVQRHWQRARRLDRKVGRMGAEFAKAFHLEEVARRQGAKKTFRMQSRQAARLAARPTDGDSAND